MSLTILYGTETGTAEFLADDLADHHGDAKVLNLATQTPTIFSAMPFLVIVTSTYGEGELPTATRQMHEDLEALKPDLSGLFFGVFSLGDQRTYPDTFANGGDVWAKTLVGLGAKQIGPVGKHDASGGDMPEEVAKPWLDAVLAEAGLA